MGIICGGVVFTYIGGYSAPGSFPLMIGIGVMAVLVSLPAPFLDSKIAVYLMMWLLLFFGAFMLPTMTGIMLNSV
jgi:hypothetical protein